MHNLTTVIIFEFIRTIKKKTFWLSLLAFPTIFGIIGGVMYISTVTADEASERNRAEGFSMVILDDSALLSPSLIEDMNASTVADKADGITAVKNQRIDAFIYYPVDPSRQPIEIYAQDAGLMKNERYGAVAQELLRTSASATIGSPQLIAVIRGNTSTDLTTYEAGEVVPGFERALAPGLFLLLFYAIIVLLGNQMLTSTTEEKENRVIEMILTTLEAKTLILGKIIALIMLGVVQVLVISLPTIIGYFLLKDRLSLPAIDLSSVPLDIIPILVGASLLILSFLLFTGILVAIGSAVPTAKEANSFFGIAIFSMFIPLYTISAIISDPTQIMVKIFTFFPLTAPVTLMIRNAVGNLTAIETTIGIAILLLSSTIALAIATHAFRYGTLEYNRKLSWKEILLIKS